jgi:hypothetical protein
MLLSFAYLAFSAVLRLLVSGRRSDFATDVELLVLRHQLAVLARQERRRGCGLPIARLLPPSRAPRRQARALRHRAGDASRLTSEHSLAAGNFFHRRVHVRDAGRE